MTEINLEHLRKVYVICETEEILEETKVFLEQTNCIGMKAHLYDKEANKNDLINEFNIAVVDTGNDDFISELINKFGSIGFCVKIIKIH